VQPGSAFKPFALAGALRDGIGLKSRYAGNSPLDIPGTDKQVNNEFDRDYGTSVDLVKATEQSINTAYVDLTLDMGAHKVVDAAVDAGIPADTPGLESNAVNTLGTASVRNIDMATAYATFAAKGKAATPYTVQEVKGANGGTRYEAHPHTSRAFDEDVVSDVSYALQQVVKNGTGTEAQSLDRPAAAKTGTAALRPGTTTSAWFVGYTPQLSAAVDFYKGTGRADLDGVGGLSTFFGGEYPARIWTAFMTAALQGKSVETFPPPSYVGETVNPQPTSTPTPTPTKSTETPSETPTVVPTTPLPTTPLPTTTPGPPSTPPGQSSPTGTIVISPPPA
jgi:membrane peptidoglycan carboxypeptidase